MTRRRSRKSASTMRLRGAERIIFILGATLYVFGMLGMSNLMAIAGNAVLFLLSVGGGLLLIVNLTLLF